MTTAFKVLLDAVRFALLTAPALADGRVDVGRDSITALNHPSDANLTMSIQQGTPFVLSDAPVDWVADIGIEIRARGTSTLDAIAALDPLMELAYARLATIVLPAGALGLTGYRGQIDVQEEATPFATWMLQISIAFRTAPGTLALAA